MKPPFILFSLSFAVDQYDMLPIVNSTNRDSFFFF